MGIKEATMNGGNKNDKEGRKKVRNKKTKKKQEKGIICR